MLTARPCDISIMLGNVIGNKIRTATQRVWGQCGMGALGLLKGQAGDARREKGFRWHREPQTPGQEAPGEPLKEMNCKVRLVMEARGHGYFHEKYSVLLGQ